MSESRIARRPLFALGALGALEAACARLSKPEAKEQGVKTPVIIGFVYETNLSTRVRALDSKPASQVEVQLLARAPKDPNLWQPESKAKTDDNGIYVFSDVAPGFYRVAIANQTTQAVVEAGKITSEPIEITANSKFLFGPFIGKVV